MARLERSQVMMIMTMTMTMMSSVMSSTMAMTMIPSQVHTVCVCVCVCVYEGGRERGREGGRPTSEHTSACVRSHGHGSIHTHTLARSHVSSMNAGGNGLGDATDIAAREPARGGGTGGVGEF